METFPRYQTPKPPGQARHGKEMEDEKSQKQAENQRPTDRTHPPDNTHTARVVTAGSWGFVFCFDYSSAVKGTSARVLYSSRRRKGHGVWDSGPRGLPGGEVQVRGRSCRLAPCSAAHSTGGPLRPVEIRPGLMETLTSISPNVLPGLPRSENSEDRPRSPQPHADTSPGQPASGRPHQCPLLPPPSQAP